MSLPATSHSPRAAPTSSRAPTARGEGRSEGQIAKGVRPLATDPSAYHNGTGDGSDPFSIARRLTEALPHRILIGTALVLAGAVAGLAAGQTMATRSAHQAGACIALNMAAALGYLDAEQQRQVRHALVTAINPDLDLFSGGRPRLQEACGARTEW